MSETKPVISVIMPIYNGEKWLAKALGSLCDQTFKNWEAVLVNDGSTDSSAEICLGFAEKNSHIRYFFKQNGGVSSARNLGIEKATGEFIYFFDCDDMLAPDTLEFLFNLQAINQADIAACLFAVIKTQAIPAVFAASNKAYQVIEPESAKWTYGEVFTRVLKCKLFTRKVIGDIRFDEQINYAEDDLFMTEVFIKANKVIYSPAIKVFYYLHEESATNRVQPYSFFEGYVQARLLIKEKVYAATNNADICMLVYHDYCTSIFALFRCVVRSGDKKQYAKLQRQYAGLLEQFLHKSKMAWGKKWEYKTYIKSYVLARLIHTRKF